MTAPDPTIMVAPNGARRGKTDHPALPVSLAETAATAQACAAAGADALHLHIRDNEGAHSLDAGRYLEALQEVGRVAPGLRLQITTEAVGQYSVHQQLECLTWVAPGWASISVREIARDPELAPRVYDACADIGCEVQHILYDTEDIRLLKHWQSSGTVHPSQSGVLFVLGRYSAGQTSSPQDLTPFLAALPEARDWMLCAFGPQEHACLCHAAKLGGNLRVGFENSLLASDGSQHRDNAASLSALMRQLERSRS